MNLQEIQSMLSTLLADSSNNFYTEAERLQAVNTACMYINGELRLLRSVANITITPLDGGVVTLPEDFVSIGQGVAWQEQNGQTTTLERRNVMQLQGQNSNWDNDVGIPQYFVLEGGNVYVTPAPQKAGVVKLSYLAMPNKLLDPTDVPFYGDARAQSYHDMIPFYAAWLLTLKDRDFEAAQTFMQYFQSRLIDLKENLRHTGDIVQPVWSDTYAVT